METKIKAFDAVGESRKWRESTSQKLDSMPLSERLKYLQTLAERYASNHPALTHKPAL